jgi:hypothetical protein
MDKAETHGPPVVAVLNTSPDTVDLLRDLFERAGFVVVSGFTFDIATGKLDLDHFLRVHRPSVILYDIAPPYERNWRFLEHLRATVLHGYRFVLTTTNIAHVQTLVQPTDEKVYEVVGRAEDLDAILRATREALRARDVR